MGLTLKEKGFMIEGWTMGETSWTPLFGCTLPYLLPVYLGTLLSLHVGRFFHVDTHESFYLGILEVVHFNESFLSPWVLFIKEPI